MVAVLESRPMTEKRRGRPKTSERKDATARLDAAVLAKAQMVAKARGVSIAEYLTDIVKGPVDRDFLKEMKKLEGESK